MRSPRRATRACSAGSSSGGSPVEPPQVDVGDGPVSDVLVDRVRRRVGKVGEQEAESAPSREERCRHVGDERARVAAAALARRRVDRSEANAVRCRTSKRGHRHGVAVQPQHEAAVRFCEATVEDLGSVLVRSPRQSFLDERSEPPKRELAVALVVAPRAAGDARGRGNRVGSIDPLGDCETARSALERLPDLDEAAHGSHRAEDAGQAAEDLVDVGGDRVERRRSSISDSKSPWGGVRRAAATTLPSVSTRPKYGSLP